MEKSRNAVQKVEKMKEMGIFDKWVSNTDKRTIEFTSITTVRQELVCEQWRNRLLSNFAYLSDMIEVSFIFRGCPEKEDFWYNIVDNLRSEI
ncbi:hypothetical protein BT528P2_00028 [Bacteroides phage BT528P2]|nr:hypothetical protein BT498P1_00025 [Bacteroides phage BT498P1]WAX09319.1 hypothetical protein BT528P1_00028 [Bacteroides phage BT528P1]WAX09365.1 hypothetical protein BT528P2_00028 [Bacteroides phage BT528P2]